MYSETNDPLKQTILKYSAVPLASLGFVTGIALVLPVTISVQEFGKAWFLITFVLAMMLMTGMVITRLKDAFQGSRIPTKCAYMVSCAPKSFENRFKGDRTDEEYQHALNGVFIVAGLFVLVGMLFIVGVWTLIAVAALLAMSLFKNVYVIFNKDKKRGYAGLLEVIFFGMFLGLMIGLFIRF